MNDNEMRIAIAEACGWTRIEFGPYDGSPFGWPPNKQNCDKFLLPDYLNDLNAMHEVVNSLSFNERLEWLSWIDKLTEDPDDKKDQSWLPLRLIRATARQRAEAFLRTIGKWKDAQ